MKKTVNLLLKLVRCEITGEPVVLPEDFSYDFYKLMWLAKEHEISQMIADALIKNDMIVDDSQLEIARRHIFNASYRDTKNNYTYELAQAVLEKAGIEYVPLKGAVMKNMYPESWMRTSCDIDILVGEKKFNNAVNALKSAGFEAVGNPGYHDISLMLDDTNLELHFSICEDINYIDKLLKKVWNYTVPDVGCRYFENNNYFAYHHIAHMAYHFLAGGCGIRTFIDLWLLRRSDFFDEEELYKLCKEAKISQFCRAVFETTDVWFEGKERTDLVDRIERYISEGGVYGNFSNNAAAHTAISGGKVKYIKSLVFPDFKNMRILYPELNKHPALLPLCHLKRITKKVFIREDRSIKKIDILRNQDSALIENVSSLLIELNLKK